MKKFIFLSATLFLLTSAFATSTPRLYAKDVIVPIGTNQSISLLDLSRITVSDFSKLTGKKMSFVEKAGFKIAQKDLRNTINSDGSINKKRVNKYLSKKADGETGFHLGGFALGFFLGLIGVLIALIFQDDNRRNRIKWSLIGVSLVLALALIATAAAG